MEGATSSRHPSSVAASAGTGRVAYLGGFDETSALLASACSALAAIVRAEYGDRYSLTEIAATWGEGIPAGEIAALEVVECALFAKPDDELIDDLGQGRDV